MHLSADRVIANLGNITKSNNLFQLQHVFSDGLFIYYRQLKSILSDYDIQKEGKLKSGSRACRMEDCMF